jgi:hypothetical protein
MKRILKQWKWVLTGCSVLLFAVTVITLWVNRVTNNLTPADEKYIAAFLGDRKRASGSSSYNDQIEFIKNVQDAVLSRAPLDKGIAFNHTREPEDLFNARHGLCFDRSRVIEKILRSNGFETRHIFVYSVNGRNSVTAFVTPGVLSHAITEVLTEKGWIVVDSNVRWISTDMAGNPHNMSELRGYIDGVTQISWGTEVPQVYRDVSPFTYVYGLYSRHGRFFPPYNPIPDVNYGELIDNL